MTRSGRTGAPVLRNALAAFSAAVLITLPLQALAAPTARAAGLVDDPASLVNPIIGTSGTVDTFPGADAPFGMVQWSPDTTPHRPDGGGYEYTDKKVSGYSLTHLSGPGCPAAGDLPILPVTSAMSGDLSATSVGIDHAKETAQAGYYALSDGSGVTTELTATARAGMGRFTFPAGSDAHLLLKLSGGATKIDGTRAQVVNDHEVTGAIDSGHFCGANNTYTLHFTISFDHPFTSSGTWIGSTVNPNAKVLKLGAPAQQLSAGTTRAAQPGAHFTLPAQRQPATHGSTDPQRAKTPANPPVVGANGVYLGFDTATSATVTAKVGISYTSDANAAGNLASEIHGWNFNSVRQAAHTSWDRTLGRIAVGGGTTDQQTQFYTALYHSLLHPNVFSDSNGQYMGMDRQIHTAARGHIQYANYSGWDTYRSQTQLMALVAPAVTSDVVQSMLNGYYQTGILPKWAQNNGESYVMVGDPADGIIADAYAFGARGFNTGDALDAMTWQATHPNGDRPGQAVRDAKGYLPIDNSTWGCCNFYGPVSTQLEYDTADYAIASLAKSLGKKDLYTSFASKAQDWQNVFNPQTGYLQAKLASGEFAAGFTPGTSNGFVEGTAAQYTPMVPFNLQALIQSRGGTAAYSGYLDGLLSGLTAPDSTHADLSNEPSVEVPWEYAYLGQPWKTQKVVRDVQQKLYFNAPVGSFGNDDLGAMSSWYVWSELGMYPETPGTDTLVLGSPVFPTARVTLGNGHTLTINAPAAATGSPYVQGLKVNGTASNQPWTTFSKLSGGATLDYDLAATPNTSWGSAASAAPPSDSTGQRDVVAATGPSGAGLVLAPGTSGTGTLDLADISDTPASVAWTAAPPSGVTMTTTSGTVAVPAHSRAEQQLQVTAGTTEGTFSVPISLSTGDGRPLPPTALRVAVATPGQLWPYATGTGVYPDNKTFGGGFDEEGWAYSQNALDAGGVKTGATVTSDGISYPWPGGSGKPDNIAAAGQTIPVAAPADATAIGFLGAAINAPAKGTSGAVTVTYTDGSTEKVTLAMSDWTLNAGASKPLPGITTVARTPYRNVGDGTKDTVATYLFSSRLPLTGGKQIASVTLPVTTDGTLHLFGIGFTS
ncbi:lectin [Streptomyces sp. H10-C2]|uniref:GH92 family glycosyl hydrolase n=1 Tax=unclassified Streptomyces TaxID=2593676 RepID=UPI0024BA3480|nr:MULTISPECIES: lectin [unclassified Streptomyces]MDJ0345159.1 lectin [Streptomyces sp. PH10-H1]MDJ0374127.1 lectin [Streptomyces sp. H10-C2]